MVTLFRMSTGESWNGIMHELLSQAPSLFDKSLTLIFFMSFTVLSSFLLLNVFVAVVLKNFEEEVMSDPNNTSNVFSINSIVQFGECWAARFTAYSCPYEELREFLETLPQPWKLHHSNFRPGRYVKMLRRMEIP